MVSLALIIYLIVLFAISRWTTGVKGTNDTFFRAERRSPWYMVAFGMVGASISGVTFVSVPGMVLTSGMTYLQVCLGFILGYLAVAYVLLPVYYRLNLTSIYGYLGHRLGRQSYLTGSCFFLLSKTVGSAVKFYVVCIIIQRMVLGELGVPFSLTVVGLVFLIWLYTHRGGVRTLVFTDVFQTLCLFSALLLIIWEVMQLHGTSFTTLHSQLWDDARSRIFIMDNWMSPQNFWKQLLSGAFIVIVMTGLDQDMMQKNLTCRTLRESQMDMCSYGMAFLPANLLFLALGILLAQLFEAEGISLPSQSDELLPMFVSKSGTFIKSLFTIGIVAASFSSADSALTSLTTCYCIDIRGRHNDETLRRRSHLIICIVFAAIILIFHALNNRSLIDAIYTLVSYTYGPLLGLFAFGLLTHRQVRDRYVPFVCISSPFISYKAAQLSQSLFGYHFGYELLMLNGLLTFIGLWVFSKEKPISIIERLKN